MKIGLYFGSFNPIHIGHSNLAEYLIDNKLVDEVWFVVSPCNPLKKRAELLDENIRLKMVELAIASKSQLKASNAEFHLPIPSYTIDSLHYFTNTYPQHNFSLLIGSDNALVFDKWKNHPDILDHYPVWVYPRFGYDFEIVADIYPQMQLLSTPFYDVSSTEIRALIAQNKDASKWIHPSVYQYILENKLYL